MSNQDTISDTLACELCEIANRIWMSGYEYPKMEKVVWLEDIYYFYQYLYRNIPWYQLDIDVLDTFIEEWKLDQAYRDWYDFYEQFIENL